MGSIKGGKGQEGFFYHEWTRMDTNLARAGARWRGEEFFFVAWRVCVRVGCWLKRLPRSLRSLAMTGGHMVGVGRDSVPRRYWFLLGTPFLFLKKRSFRTV